ncbi:MAG: UvrD-helicase domain-containing protein [Clostridia bacterium]|nr:UvrD-helicase domain-containing protein [Clostridia bacterium]
MSGFTASQEQAVFWKGGNLLLSAAAGSGKTYTLIARIVELIKSGEADMNEILVVTFTRAAAAELKVRISTALAEEAKKPENREVLSRISTAMSQVPSADISTIHSFLYRNLRQYFPQAGFPSDATLREEGEIAPIRAEIMKELVDELYSGSEQGCSGGSEGFIRLSDALGRTGDEQSIDRWLLETSIALASHGRGRAELSEYAEILDDIARGRDIMETAFGKVITGDLERISEYYLGALTKCLDDMKGDENTLKKYGPEAENIIGYVRDVISCLKRKPGYDELKETVNSFVKGRITGSRKTDASERFMDFRKDFEDDLKSLKKRYFAFDLSTEAENASRTADLLRTASDVITEYRSRFESRKKGLSVVEYSDLETISYDLLVDGNGEPTAVAREIGGKYKYIFIDEYQDTNRIQDSIFRAVSSEAKRFMVGDIKQAIYRFRGADPSIFAEYRTEWKTIKDGFGESEKFSIDGGRSVFMSENFRCDEPIIEFANCVSSSVFPYGKINYVDEDRLVFAKDTKKTDMAKVEVCIVDTSSSDPEDGADDPEAEYVAERIAGMLGRYRDSGERRIQPGDIAILLRSGKKDGLAFRRALEKRAVPVSLKTGSPLSASPAVMLILCILNFIDNPLRDIYVSGALRSPVFGFSLGEIAEIRRKYASKPLYPALLDHAEKGDDELAEKCRFVAGWISRHRTITMGMRIDRYLEFLIDDVNLFSIKGVRGNGMERDAVNRFCAKAAEFSSSASAVFGSGDISGFLSSATGWLDDPEAGTGGQDTGNSVLIDTIHSSKGLEYPIVFLAKCGKKFNDQDTKRNAVFDPGLGLGIMLPDERGLVRCNTLVRSVISEKIGEELTCEEMRLLYVALTRAREKLVVTAGSKKPEKLLSDAEKQAVFSGEYPVVNAGGYINWVLYALNLSKPRQTEVKVIRACGTAEITGISDGDSFDDSEVSEEELIANLEFEYPFEYLKGIPSSLTISKLYPSILDESGEEEKSSLDRKRTFNLKSIEKPRFLSGESGSALASDIGTATHLFFQFADFRRLLEAGAEEEIARLIRERYISEKDAELIDKDQIREFAKTELIGKIIRSRFVKREFRFLVKMDASGLTENSDLAAKLEQEGTKLLTKGAVDCLFRDPDTDELVVIDYKTDRFGKEDLEKAEGILRERHGSQLRYYAAICSDIFLERVQKAYVYSTFLHALVPIPLGGI